MMIHMPMLVNVSNPRIVIPAYQFHFRGIITEIVQTRIPAVVQESNKHLWIASLVVLGAVAVTAYAIHSYMTRKNSLPSPSPASPAAPTPPSPKAWIKPLQELMQNSLARSKDDEFMQFFQKYAKKFPSHGNYQSTIHTIQQNLPLGDARIEFESVVANLNAEWGKIQNQAPGSVEALKELSDAVEAAEKKTHELYLSISGRNISNLLNFLKQEIVKLLNGPNASKSSLLRSIAVDYKQILEIQSAHKEDLAFLEGLEQAYKGSQTLRDQIDAIIKAKRNAILDSAQEQGRLNAAALIRIRALLATTTLSAIIYPNPHVTTLCQWIESCLNRYPLDTPHATEILRLAYEVMQKAQQTIESKQYAFFEKAAQVLQAQGSDRDCLLRLRAI